MRPSGAASFVSSDRLALTTLACSDFGNVSDRRTETSSSSSFCPSFPSTRARASLAPAQLRAWIARVRTDAIPIDHEGAMGVPITFLDRYNPDQFEILGITDRDNNSGVKTKEYTEADAPNFGDLNRRGVVRVGSDYKLIYARLIIRRRRRSARETKK
jgi:hypothetical protein